MVYLEYDWIWSVLWTALHGLNIWGIMVCSSNLADYDFGWTTLNTSFWQEDTREAAYYDSLNFGWHHAYSDSLLS